MHKVVEFLPGRLKLIELQITLMRALESHTQTQRQWKGELPRVQITGYVSVCAQVWQMLFLTVWVTATHTWSTWYPNPVLHLCPQAWAEKSTKQAQVQSDKYTFLWVVSCLCVAFIERFVYGVQGHTSRFSWSMFVFGSQRICLHMLHILGVFSFMCQQQCCTYQELRDWTARTSPWKIFAFFSTSQYWVGLNPHNYGNLY